MKGFHTETDLPVEHQVAWHLLRRVYRNEAINGVFTLIASAVLALVVSVYALARGVPLAWWSILASLVLVRLLIAWRFFSTAQIGDLSRWHFRYEALSFLTGCAWGIGGAAMYLAVPVPESHTAILVVIAVMTAAALSYQAALLRAYTAYLLGALLPLAVVMAQYPGAIKELSGLLPVAYCAVMWAIAKSYNRDAWETTRLGYQTQHLSKQLAATNEQLERDIDARIQAEKLLQTEKHILENVARQKSLTEVLDELNLDVEALYPGSRCSVLLLDPDRRTIKHGSAPSLPKEYCDSVDGAAIGPNVGSCGTAMYRKEQVVVEDIATDPLWRDYRDLALPFDLRACWSTPIMSPSGDVLGSFAIYRNIPQLPTRDELETVNRMSRLISLVIEEVRVGEQIRLSEQRFRDFAGAAADWFWEVNRNFDYTYVSKTMHETGGWPKEAIMKRTLEELRQTVLHNPGDGEAIDDSTGVQKPLVIDFTVSTEDHEKIEVMSIVRPTFDEQNRFSGWRGVGRDVTRERQLEREIRFQAAHDSLTGLCNRREFDLRIRDMLTEGSGNHDRYVAFIDLDRFKLINDNAGHYAGDAVLKRVADILSKGAPADKVVARLGGDEFGVCFTTPNAKHALTAMESLINVLTNTRFEWGNTSFHLGASIGLVRVTTMYKTSAQVLSDADASCYRAKSQGGNCVCLYQPNLDVFTDDSRNTSELMKALQNNRTLIHVQQILAVQRTEVTPWFEVLLRYSSDNNLASSPSRLIPAAERYGQMGVVDTWVLEQCLERWRDLLAKNSLRLSINLSATSITHQDTANEIAKLVEQARVAPGSLCFEITETSTVHSLGGAAQFMRDLRGLGCGFVIDNFGGGQSNFSYLKSLPGDYLAIDGSYVRTMTDDMANYTIVDSIHKVARAHGMMTLAKFVESEEILNALRGLGVEYAQGYHVGKSIPASDLDQIVRATNAETSNAAGVN